MLPPPIPLVGAIESISSKKIMHGAACLARLKTSRTPLSDSPTHLLSNSGPLTLMKFASLSVATAFASSVFPVPEGPNRRIPLGMKDATGKGSGDRKRSELHQRSEEHTSELQSPCNLVCRL